jgi:hypothetical protein
MVASDRLRCSGRALQRAVRPRGVWLLGLVLEGPIGLHLGGRALYLLNQGDILATAVPGFPVWDLAGPIGSTGWGLWVAALGVTILLRPAPATLRRPAPATRPAGCRSTDVGPPQEPLRGLHHAGCAAGAVLCGDDPI